MTSEVDKKHRLQVKRKIRVRKALHGTSIKPRLSVMKSNKHIHAQLIDDDKSHTLGAVSTDSKQFKNTEFKKKNKVSARKLGETIGALALKMNIKEIIFDRGPYKYHGILAELADGARQAGLKF
jgi:large subunit ribosomal protein L18